MKDVVDVEEINLDFSFYPWCFWDGAFTDEEIDQIVELSSSKELEQGKTDTTDEIDEYRNSKVNFHNCDENNKWIFERLNYVIQQINSKFYKFDLFGYNFYQYSEYEASVNARYDFHMDLFLSPNCVKHENGFRKLSLTLLLNRPNEDYKGGEFHILTGKPEKYNKVVMKKGTIILFPSFVIHRVTPITEGIRKSLVIWIDGPRFK